MEFIFFFSKNKFVIAAMLLERLSLKQTHHHRGRVVHLYNP